jgi:AP-3 complex subunit beta
LLIHSLQPNSHISSHFFLTDREQFQLGSLSHYVNARAPGYQEIPSFPLEAPDPTARDVETSLPWQEPERPKKQSVKKRSFYSASESDDGNFLM